MEYRFTRARLAVLCGLGLSAASFAQAMDPNFWCEGQAMSCQNSAKHLLGLTADQIHKCATLGSGAYAQACKFADSHPEALKDDQAWYGSDYAPCRSVRMKELCAPKREKLKKDLKKVFEEARKISPICAIPMCSNPPEGCHFGPAPVDEKGCQVGCGPLVCSPNKPAPFTIVMGLRFENFEDCMEKLNKARALPLKHNPNEDQMPAEMFCREKFPEAKKPGAIFRARWNQEGGEWTTGWVENQPKDTCGHSVNCNCHGQNHCGQYKNGDTTVYWANGCSADPWKIRCLVEITAVPTAQNEGEANGSDAFGHHAPAPVELAVDVELKDFKDCFNKVESANKIPAHKAPWIDPGSHQQMDTKVYCRTHFPDLSTYPQGIYRARWDQVGGTWTTGWVNGVLTPQCGAGYGCKCGDENFCGHYKNGETTTYWPGGCDKPKGRIKCTAEPMPD